MLARQRRMSFTRKMVPTPRLLKHLLLALSLTLAAPLPLSAQNATMTHNEEAEEDALAGAPPDVALVGRLLMMKGHLRIGRELWDGGMKDEGGTHFLHPLVELWGDVEPELTPHGVKSFKGDLEALGAAADKGGDVAGKFKTAIGDIDHAIKRAGAGVRKSPAALYDVTLRVLRTIAHEYGNGFEDGTIIAPVEYQDARGFGLALRDFLAANAWSALQKEVGAILAATPQPVPPSQAKVSPAAMHQAVARVEALRARFE